LKTKKILVISLVLVLLTSFTAWAQEQTQTTQKNPIEKIIELIVENNPTLQSQRDLIKEIEEMPAHRRYPNSSSKHDSTGRHQGCNAGEKRYARES
jgi:hypothetical protein